MLYPVAAAVAIIIGLGIGYWTAARPHAPPKTAALLLNPPKSLPAFSLEGDANAPFTKEYLEGHWSLLYFGYTHCPDVCPMTMANLNKMMVQLKSLPAAKQPRVYFISVDPRRDTPTLLKGYVQYFNSSFMGVTGTVVQLRDLTKPLGVAFSHEPPNQSGNYRVDHSAIVFFVNPKGRESAIFAPPMIPESMAADYRAILGYSGDR